MSDNSLSQKTTCKYYIFSGKYQPENFINLSLKDTHVILTSKNCVYNSGVTSAHACAAM